MYRWYVVNVMSIYYTAILFLRDREGVQEYGKENWRGDRKGFPFYGVLGLCRLTQYIRLISEQSIQSARLSVQSSGISPSPTPARVCFSPPPPLGPRGKRTRVLGGEWMGGPILTKGQTLWYSMFYNPSMVRFPLPLPCCSVSWCTHRARCW